MFNIKQYWFFVLIFIFLGNSLSIAQKDTPEIPSYLLVHLSFSFQKPGGDLGDRFDWNNSAGVGVDYLTSKNFIFGAQVDYLFGTRVREDVLFSLRNSDGDIIGNNRGVANISLTQRGWQGNVLLGKLFPFGKAPRAGLRTTVGVGFLQHKIRIQQDPQSLVPQTTGDYRKGYDRLTNGLSVTEFIGYQMISPNKRVNFIFGLELVQGFTKNRREWNFDQGQKDTTARFDFILGGKLAWTIPFELGNNGEGIYY